MSEHPSEQEKLIQDIAAPASGTHGREAARAKLDSLLLKDLTTSLGQLGGELAKSSEAASRHQRALVRWTAVLSFATIAYAVVAFMPFLWRYSVASGVSESAWVLWTVDTDDSDPKNNQSAL